MDIERRTVVEAGIGSGAVVLFIAGVYGASLAYSTNGGLTAQGGLAIVAAVAAFVVVLSLAGYWLSRQNF
jgi:hypothetical protein